MDGLDRLIDGLGGLKDVFGRLGLGATDLDRLDMRLCRPLGALGLGADCTIGDGLRLICGLGLELNDRDPIDPPGFIAGGREGICGEACGLGAGLLTLGREAATLLRPRDWPQACGPADGIIPTTTATINEPQTRFLAFQGPAVREWSLSRTANIEILLSPRR